MPTYEYVCRTCGHLFEIVQSMMDDPLTECPECGGELRKVFAPPAIAFKGSGFYATDHGKKSKVASERSDSKDKPGTGGDKKPAASTESTSSSSDKGSDKGSDKSGGSSEKNGSSKGDAS